MKRHAIPALATLLCATVLAAPLSSPAAAAPGKVLVERDSNSQRVEFVRATGKGADLNPSLSGRSKSASATKAEDWLADQAALFGVSPDELILATNETSAAGRTLTYTQEHDGVPVFGAALKANLDTAGALTSVNGHVVPGLDLPTTPGVSAGKAEAEAIDMVRQDPPTSEGDKKASLEGAKAEATLVIYETGSTLGQSGIPYLAWQVEVTAGATVREQVILDAHKLKPLNRWSDGHTALNRQLRTVSTPGIIDVPDDDVFEDVWTEGQPTDSLSQKRKDLMSTTGETYNLFNNLADRDSFDGNGAQMVLVDSRADRCPNASWNGEYTSYCPGLESDDVVAHEWGHAYTEYTSGLIYQWQAGALNESYSDVWGETVDLLNNREDEGEAAIDVVRADDTCAKSTASARTATVVIDSPAGIAGPCLGAKPSLNGPRLPATPQTVQVVVGLDDANPTGPSTTDGCTAFTNTAAVSGKWVYLDRGTCTFTVKANNVQAAGGRGLLVSSGAGTAPFAPTGNSPVAQFMISQDRGDAIKSVSPGTPVTVTLSGNDPAGVANDRWLVGEQTTAFPGALRDMWNPTCKGDPAKVTDAEYYCGDDDNGGVHGNSGVPNRAYSLAVDGGTFNDQTVTGLGLDKAAQIWWRAGASYLTPISDFNDFASSLTQSCTTLVGTPIKKLSLTSTLGSAASSVTAADCAQLEKVIIATELRTDPVARCNQTPQFTAGEPVGCGAGTTQITVLKQDFENGLAGWTPSVAPAGGAMPGPSSWTIDSKAPNNDGTAAFVANPYGAPTSSLAGISSLTSPEFTLNAGLSPRLTFRHAVSLEADYDGANVKLSVNGGTFEPVPNTAYTHNAPNLTVVADASDNPMVGQAVWSGVESQTLGSRWGTTQVDLSAAGVTPGDTVRVRFDLGTDTYAGWHGWYVDDVSVTYCAITTSVAATAPANWIVGHASQLPVEVSSSDNSTATGDVEVRDSTDALLGTATLADGSATVTLPDSVTAGTHQLKVAYLGTAAHAPSAIDLDVTVKATTTVTATPPTNWIMGHASQLPVEVSSSDNSTATGDVEVRDSTDALLGTATLADGSATVTLPDSVTAGTHQLKVAYLGTDSHAPSSADVSVTVKATTRVAVSAPPSWTIGSTARIPVKVVTATGAPATGTIELRAASGALLSSATLAGGTATLSAPKTLKAGSQRLTVAYLGNGTSAAATSSITATVKATSKTSIKVSPSKLRRGKAFTVRATVRSTPGATGKVTFTLNGRTVGSATIKGGRATLKISAKKAKKLKVSSKKSNSIRATYAGSTKVAGSNSTTKVRARR